MEALFAILGLFVGGLMNAVADRIPPLDPEYDGPFISDTVRPLKWWEYLPFLSFVSASRSPRMKVANFAWRYPVLEVATALAFWLAVTRFSDHVAVMIAVALFAASLITLAFIDFETKYLPFKLVYPTGIAALAFAPFWPDLAWWQSLAGAAAGFAVFYPIYWLGIRLNSPLMGGGDAYLAAAMGAMLGLQMLFLGLYIGVVVGGIAALVVLAGRMFGKQQRVIAYGPYLSIGWLVALYYGRPIMDFILGT
jgi:prepilin signal peptidase PulO-like enzyme (type II secretory pathway)